MEVNSCLNCVASCCRLEIDINESEYNNLREITDIENLITRTEKFIASYPSYKGKEIEINKMYGETFALIQKGTDGFCSLLDRKTRLCKVYENRPKVCVDYGVDSLRCKKIKQCIV